MKKVLYQKEYPVDVSISESTESISSESAKMFFDKLKAKIQKEELSLVPIESKIRNSKKFIACAKELANSLKIDIKVSQTNRGITVTFFCDILVLSRHLKTIFIELLNLADECSFYTTNKGRFIITLEYSTHKI